MAVAPWWSVVASCFGLPKYFPCCCAVGLGFNGFGVTGQGVALHCLPSCLSLGCSGCQALGGSGSCCVLRVLSADDPSGGCVHGVGYVQCADDKPPLLVASMCWLADAASLSPLGALLHSAPCPAGRAHIVVTHVRLVLHARCHTLLHVVHAPCGCFISSLAGCVSLTRQAAW